MPSFVLHGHRYPLVMWTTGVAALLLAASFLAWHSGSTQLDCDGGTGQCRWRSDDDSGPAATTFDVGAVDQASIGVVYRTRSSGFRSHHRCCFRLADATPLCFPWSSTWYPDSRSADQCRAVAAAAAQRSSLSVADSRLSVGHAAVSLLFAVAAAALLFSADESVSFHFDGPQPLVAVRRRRLFGLVAGCSRHALLDSDGRARWSAVACRCVSSRRARHPRYQIYLRGDADLALPVLYASEKQARHVARALVDQFRVHQLPLDDATLKSQFEARSNDSKK